MQTIPLRRGALPLEPGQVRGPPPPPPAPSPPHVCPNRPQPAPAQHEHLPQRLMQTRRHGRRHCDQDQPEAVLRRCHDRQQELLDCGVAELRSAPRREEGQEQ